MEIFLRPVTEADFSFSYEVKRLALGPYVTARWGWDDSFQHELHRRRWNERPWSIIVYEEQDVGTASIDKAKNHIQFGEFYLLPQFQGKGIGTEILQSVLEEADELGVCIKLEYLRWNPVGSLYKRHGFKIIEENDTHYFLVRLPTR